MKFPPALLALVGSVLLVGCSTYRALPLDHSAVDQALQEPKLESIKIAAAQFKHPLIHSIVIRGDGGYTPDELAVMSVIVSPAMRALRDQRGVAEAQVVQAGILPNPQLSYSVDRPHGNADPTLVSAFAWGLSWDVTSLITHHAQVVAARENARSLDLSVAWQEWQTAEDARLRALRIVSLEERLPLARQVETALRDTVDLTRRAVQLGSRTLTDLTTITAAWTAAQNTRFDLETQLVKERAALNLSLALPPERRVQVKASPAADTRWTDAAIDQSLASLEERRLDLAALRLGYASEEASVRSAVLAQFPRIGLSVNQAQDTTPVKTRGFGVTADLPIFDRNQGQIAIGKATRQQLFDEYVARVAEARSEVAQIRANLKVLHAQIAAVDASLPELRQLDRSFQTALKEHNAELLVARDAAAAVATRQIERSALQQQLSEQYSALEIATGTAPSQPSVP